MAINPDIEFSIKQGTVGASLDVTLYNDDSTPLDLTDADEVQLTLRPEESETELWTKDALVLGDPTLGQLRYVWAGPSSGEPGDTDTPGTYYGEFKVHFPAGWVTYPVDGYLLIEIEPNLEEGVEMTPGAFATVSDVRKYTRKSVTEDDLAIAQVMVEALVGRSVEDIEMIAGLDELVGTQDSYWLKIATAWQARWVASQPDLFERWSVRKIQQDGFAATLSPLANLYAPMCSMALSRLSWMRSRKVRVRRPSVGFSRNYLTDDSAPFAGTELDSGWKNLR